MLIRTQRRDGFSLRQRTPPERKKSLLSASAMFEPKWMRAAWAPNSSYDYVQSVLCNMRSGYEGGWTLAHEPTTKTQPVSSLSEVSSNCKCGHEYPYDEICCHRCGTKRSDSSITKAPQPLPPMPASGDTKALSWSRPSLCVNESNEDCGRTLAFTLRKAHGLELG